MDFIGTNGYASIDIGRLVGANVGSMLHGRR